MNIDRQDEEDLQSVHAKVKEALDMTNNQDEELLARLTEMRMKALSSIPDKAPVRHWFLSASSIGAVTAVVLVAIVTFLPRGFISVSNSRSPAVDILLDQLDVITHIEDLEMLEEHDFEFYIWLEGEAHLTQG